MAKYITLDGLGTFLSKLKDGSYKASTSEFGAIKIGYTQSGKNYPVQLDTNGKAYVNVPWSDSNTDTKVTQTVTTSNANYPLLLAPSSQTATTTTTSYFDSGVTLNPSTNTIAANISGNAATATKLGTTIVGSASKPIYLNSGTPTACTSIDNTLISKSNGTSTLAWNSEVTLATIAGQAIKAKLPANPNTDTKVTQTVTTSNANYPLLLAPSSQTATTTTTSYFDSGVTLNPSTNILSGAKVYESLLQWGNTNISGSLSPIDVVSDDEWSANRLSFMPASDIQVEYSTNGGSTWADYDLTDNQKRSFVTTGLSCSLHPGKNTTRQKANTDRLRVTITASSGKTYFSLKKIYMYISQNGASGCKVIIEKAQCGSDTTFVQVGEYSISGWSGWNSIPLINSFGGGDTQTSNIRRLRFTYYFTSYPTGYGETDDKKAVIWSISKLKMLGETSWSNSGGSLAATGHIYSYDIDKNTTFPANVKANTFIGNLSGTATTANNATNVNIATSSNNSSYPLLFTSSVTAGNKRIYTDSANNLSYNPSTNELTTSGDIRFSASNTNKYITFDSNDSLKNSWRIGYLGSGSADANYLTFESGQSTGTFVNALQISNVNLTSTFSGDVLPATNNAKNLGSSTLKWANAYATTFHGALDGNAATATKLGTTTIGSASKPIYLNSGTPTACTSIDNSFISKTGGTSTLAWNSEVTLATIAGQAIKAKLPANPNTNTAHNHAAGVGLTCDNTTGTTSGTVTYKAKLKSETASTLDSAAMGSTASRQYAVGVDKSGYLSVNVPWTDNNTDTKVTQTVTTSNANYPLLLAPSSQTATTTTTSYFDSGVTLNPSTNTIAANISGKATLDGSGRTITSTYSTTGHTHGKITLTGDVTGSATIGSGTTAVNITTTVANNSHTHTSANITDSISAASGITSNASGLTQGQAVEEYVTGITSEMTHVIAEALTDLDYRIKNDGPISHASTATTYGVATTTNYGHVKIHNGDVNVIASASGLAAGMDHKHSNYSATSHSHGKITLSGDVSGSATIGSGTTAINITTTVANNSHTHTSANITDSISAASGITSTASGLTQGKAVQAFAAPKSHASTATTYGVATTANYGHVKIHNGDVSTVASANGLAAGMDHYHTKTRIATTSSNAYMPMLFVNATASGDTTIYIDSSTGTAETSNGIRYNPSGNTCYCSGGFYELSDERLKNFGDDIDADLDKLAQIPKKYFTWKHDKNGKVYIGTSAQELQKIYPELVDELEDGTLIVSYETLSVVALKGVDVLYEKYKTLEERLNKIEKMLG